MSTVATHLIAASVGFWVCVALEIHYRWVEHAVARCR